MPRTLRVFLVVSATSVIGGVVWLVMRWPPGPLGHIAGAAMILSGVAAAAEPLSAVTGRRRVLAAALGAAVIGGVAEIIGLYHRVFGVYVYTDRWHPAVTLPGGYAFPVLLPVVWSTVLTTCYAYTRQRLNTVAAVCAAALLAAILDAVSEALFTGPVGFWIWLEPAPFLGAPWANFLGWTLTSLLGCAWVAFVTQGRPPSGNASRWMILGALAGVVIIGLTHGERRAAWALLPMVPVLIWQPRATN
jgi:uncharacterized membrane protein